MQPHVFDADPAYSRLLTMPVTVFLVPRAVVSSPKDWRSRNVTARPVNAQVGFLKVPAWQVTLRGALSKREARFLSLIRQMFAADSQEIFETVAVRVDDRFQLMVLRANADYIVEAPAPRAEAGSKRQLAEVRACAAYADPLRRLAQVTGRSVTFHHGNPGAQLPHPDRDGIHIYTNSYPVGLNKYSRAIATAFGLNIAEDGKEVTAKFPTLGRGVVMKDEDGQDMVQVVDNNWYLLLPTISCFNEETSLEIFERLLAFGLMAEVQSARSPRQVKRKAYMTGMKASLDHRVAHFDGKMREAVDNIENLQRALLVEEQKLREIIVMRDAWRRAAAREFRQISRGREFERLAAHPQIERFYLIDDGFLQICTKPIVIEHEGKRYAMGEFVITLNGWQEVGMHCESSPHPRGVQHVHIGVSGNPCFGNAGVAINKALADFRIADAVCYMLTWLTQGYTPELAEVKIEEWPLVADEPPGEET